MITTGGNLLQLTQGVPYAVINILLALSLYIVLARPTFFKEAEIHDPVSHSWRHLQRHLLRHFPVIRHLGEVVGERSGIVNLGLEGVLLVSAASGVAVASLTGNPYLGILAAMLAGGLMNLMFGYLVITRKANQLASGLAMMFFGFGLSALIGKDFVGVRIAALPRLLLPGLSGLPRLYTSLFKFDYLDHSGRPHGLPDLVAAVPHPLGSGLAGSGRECRILPSLPGAIRCGFATRRCFSSGLLAGLGAAHLAIAYTMSWTQYMTGGMGFIAVALVIFSKWHPFRAIAGVLHLQRSGRLSAFAAGERRAGIAFPAEYDPVYLNHYRY